MDTVKVNLAAMNGKLDRNEKDFGRIEENLKSNVDNVKAVEKNVVAKVELVQESNRLLKADNVEMKKSLNEIMKQLERMTQQTPHEVQAEEMKKGIAEAADGVDREPKIVIAGGKNGRGKLNSVEMFSLSNGTWTPLQPMREYREEASSVVHNNQLFVVGGDVKFIERLPLNAVHADQSTTWENLPVESPVPLEKHCSVVYNGHLIVIGGDGNSFASFSNRIIELSLVPPYICKLLASMPQGRRDHGVALFGDKILIVGGLLNGGTVLEYDITENVFRRMTSLPYHVYNMAMIKWNDNFILLGGWGKKSGALSKVLMYNIQSEKSYMLPEMLYKRTGCVAAVVRDTVIVMGGYDEEGNYLKSVESFRFDRFTWEELAEMHEERYKATAVVC
jgi:hypothetical protein